TPPAVIAELKTLQDRVPPMALEDVHATIAETLGAPASELFARFDDEPLACASIGQVHRARLGDDEVVVKVQRPRIRAIIERDLDLLHFLPRLTERTSPQPRVSSSA